jgi:hypothetical protein
MPSAKSSVSVYSGDQLREGVWGVERERVGEKEREEGE